MKPRTQFKADTAENWKKAVNFIPLEGEPIIYTDLNKMKIGDGITVVDKLPFAGETSHNVQDEVLTL